tara:strand:- start:1056 stop:1493 length:438 start_codon:yes stop_codon:yes gene_type:complete
MSVYLSIDPGIKKCGLLLAEMESGKVIEAGVASLKKFSDLVSIWNEDYEILNIIIGNGTNSKYVGNQLKIKNLLNIHYVNEEGSTLKARFRYWEIWPPNYLVRWLPREVLFPPDNLDAIVALILLEDFLNYTFSWPVQLDIKTWP